MVKRSARNIQWIEDHCYVPEGMLVGQKVKLHKVQRQIMRSIYDSPTRQAIISFPRKNGKTALSAMLLLLHLVGPEARPNSQLYSAARSRDQAAILFSLAAKMVRMSTELSSYVRIRESTKHLLCEDLGTVYRALSADAPTTYGLSPVFAVHDELGQVKGPRSELYSAIETAFGAQEDPLSIVISTQAATDADLLSVLIDSALEGNDPETKVFVWSVPEDADPFCEKTWKIANPMYGVILNPKEIKKQAGIAKNMPSQEAAFRNLMLNQRVNVDEPFISETIWKACRAVPDLEVLRDNPVFVGMDLSARGDLTALVYGAHDENRIWHVWADFFAPKKGLIERAKRDRVPYDAWVKQGWITATPGSTVEYAEVADRLLQLCDDYDVQAISFDRWRMDVLEKELERLGVELKRAPDGPLFSFGQGFRSMGPALDLLEGVLVGERVRHGGNPVLTMCAANARATMDPAGNRKLDKKKATGRIDGVVAMAMMLGVSVERIEKIGPSVYEERGLLEI